METHPMDTIIQDIVAQEIAALERRCIARAKKISDAANLLSPYDVLTDKGHELIMRRADISGAVYAEMHKQMHNR